jgi:hypothetical protein
VTLGQLILDLPLPAAAHGAEDFQSVDRAGGLSWFPKCARMKFSKPTGSATSSPQIAHGYGVRTKPELISRRWKARI